MKKEDGNVKSTRKSRAGIFQELRIEKKVTQAEVAEKIGVGEKQVSKWERGIADPKLDTIPVLANYYHVSTDRIFGYELKDDSSGTTGGQTPKKLVDKVEGFRCPICFFIAALGISEYRGVSVMIVAITCLLLFFALSVRAFLEKENAVNNKKSHFPIVGYVLYLILVFACPKLVVESVLLFVATAIFLIRYRFKKNNYALNVAANLDLREKLINA